MKNYIVKIVILFLLTSCASSYVTLNPKSLSYSNLTQDKSISVMYKYDVLRSSGNNKYAKMETKNALKLVALKITNNTDTVIDTSTDLQFYAGQNQFIPLEVPIAFDQLKQKEGAYFWYLLLTPMVFKNGTQTTPIGLGVGPGLSLINYGIASSANSDFKQELSNYRVTGKKIQKGETIYCLVSFYSNEYSPIEIKLKK